MKIIKNTLKVLLFCGVVVGCFQVYQVQFNYNFSVISQDKVYKSGAIPPEKLPRYIAKYNIKTVVDLRKGTVVDPLNPALNTAVKEEAQALSKLDDVNYIHLPSKQIPTSDNLEKFYKIIEEEDNYPLLIHCHHGTGRAILYSAIYRIEREGLTNEEARSKTRFPVLLSNFDHNTPKGEWLKQYEHLNKSMAEVIPAPAVQSID